MNLDRLQDAITKGKLNAAETIPGAALVAAGVLGNVKDGVRLLGRGAVTSKITIEVAGATAGAVAAVEKAGGKVVVLAPKAPKAEAAAE